MRLLGNEAPEAGLGVNQAVLPQLPVDFLPGRPGDPEFLLQLDY